MSILKAIGAIAPIAGSLLGFGADQKASKRAAQQAAQDRQFQMDMAKSQIQWRVADAQKAGIHPLYALGPTGMSYNPPAVVADGGGGHLAQMGQDISRAAMSQMDQRERAQALRVAQYQNQIAAAREAVADERNAVLFDQQTRRNEIEIQMRASQLARLNAPGTGVPYENAPPGSVTTRPARTTSHGLDNALGREAGAIRDYGYAYNDTRGLVVVPSYDIHERIEDNFLQQWSWAIRNQLSPAFGGLTPPNVREFPVDDPENQRWEWDFSRQAFYPQEFRTGRWVR